MSLPRRRLILWVLVALAMAWGFSLAWQPTQAQQAGPAKKAPARGEAGQPAGKAQPQARGAKLEHPFPRRTPAPALDGGIAWLNTAGPLDIKDLKGKFVLLDFWTYCCINCIHILPELKKLEHAYPNELVVIGVHSAKFENEKESENIRAAILRYEIEHPVVNDAEHKIWNKYFVRSWPSLRLIDPEGNIVAMHSGEITFEDLDAFFKRALPYYRQQGLLDETPLKFDLEAMQAKQTPLRFPGKVLADEAGGRLFIADSNHNRIVVSDLSGKLIETIGAGSIGRADGDYAKAQFDHPQGMALEGRILYVADTENHMLRKVDLVAKRVTTIAGTGTQARGGWPGMDQVRSAPAAKLPDRWVGPPMKTALNSPWAVLAHEGNLYIAMAGPHQIWKMPLDESEIGPYAGNGREDIIDGPLLPRTPYELGYSSFAQPSGLASDGTWFYVADSEGSAIRAVPFDPTKRVRTVVGVTGSLFDFGDVDGVGNRVRLQHVLGIAYYEGKLYIADTYNHKIKVIDPVKRSCTTIVGTGEKGTSDDPPLFNEPAGISAAAGKLFVADTNNHLIRVVDLSSDYRVSTLPIEGLTPPAPPRAASRPSFPDAVQVKLPAQTVRPAGEAVKLAVRLEMPPGWKINPLAPQRYLVEIEGSEGPVRREGTGKLVTLEKPAAAFEVALPLAAKSGQDAVKLTAEYYYCQIGAEGLCKTGSVTWTVPLTVSPDADAEQVGLDHKVQ